MKVIFKSSELEEYYVTPLSELRGELPLQREIIKQFKRKVQILIGIDNLEELKQFRSLSSEYLKGDREESCSIRLNRTYRLIFNSIEQESGDVVMEVILITEISKHYEK